MNDVEKSKAELIAELQSMRQQVSGMQAVQSAADDLSGTVEQLSQDLAALQELRQEIEALHAAGQALSDSQDTLRALQLMLDALKRPVPYDSAIVLRLRNGYLELVSGAGLPNQEQHQGRLFHVTEHSPLRSVLDSCSPLVIADMSTAASNGEASPLAAAGIRSWMGLPLLFAGRLVGLLCLGQNTANRYTPEHLSKARDIAPYVAAAIESSQLQDSLSRRTTELDTLLEASSTLTSSLDFQQVLDTIVESVFKLVNGPKDVHIFLYEAGEITFGSAYWDGQLQHRPINVPRPGGLTDTVAKTGEPIFVDDMRTHPIYRNAPSEWQGAIVGLPLHIGARVVGVMNFTYPQAHQLSSEETRLMKMLANQAAIGIEHARLYAAAQQELEEHKRAEAERTRLQEEIIQVQEQTLAELSTPLIPISENVVVMPLIGAADQRRAQRILETLLHGVEQLKARVAILDITGIPVVDSQVASTVIAAAQSARLLGAEVVLTGIRPEVAETLVGLGVDFQGLVTYSNLQRGVAYSLGRA